MSLGDRSDLSAMRALAHPLRLRMLSLLTGAAMSAAEVARELDITHANASYHLRQLLAAGQVVVVEEVDVRGGRARRYRHDVDRAIESEAARRPRDAESRRAVYLAMADELRRRAIAAAGPPARQSLTDAELWVPEDEWSRLLDRVTGLMDELHRAAVPPGTPGAVHTNTTMAMFVLER